MDTPNAAAPLDVFSGFGTALRRTRRLFLPAHVGDWLSVGVLAFLEGVGGVFTAVVAVHGGTRLHAAAQAGAKAVPAPVLAVLGMIGALLGLLLLLGMTWVSSRATMALVRACATGELGLVQNWRQTRRPARSLFLFRVGLLACWLVYALVSAAILHAVTNGFEEVRGAAIAAIAFVILTGCVLGVATLVVSCFTRNLAAPLMWKRDLSWRQAWGLLHRIVAANPASSLLFLMLRLAMAVCMGAVADAAAALTFGLALLPVVGQSLLAPAWIFERTYSLAVLGSLGPDFAIFTAPDAAEAPDPSGEDARDSE